MLNQNKIKPAIIYYLQTGVGSLYYDNNVAVIGATIMSLYKVEWSLVYNMSISNVYLEVLALSNEH